MRYLMLQQLAIAQALVLRPRVLPLDEPTGDIQPSIIEDIGRMIEGLRATGSIAVVLVEQDFDFAVGLVDHVVALSRGAVSRSAARGDVSRETLLEAVSI